MMSRTGLAEKGPCIHAIPRCETEASRLMGEAVTWPGQLAWLAKMLQNSVLAAAIATHIGKPLDVGSSAEVSGHPEQTPLLAGKLTSSASPPPGGC